MNGARNAGDRRRGWLWTSPGWTVLILGVFLPLALMLGASFLSRGDYGEMALPWTLENYLRLAGWGELGWEPIYPRVLLRTILVSAAVVLMTLVAALPLAFFIASRGPRGRAIGLALVIIPFWTNLLIRTYAWQILLGAGGPLATVATALGWIAEGEGLYPGWMAVFLVMFCDFLPFMALPVYASVEKLDWTLVDAAADLGATGPGVFRHAIWPQLLPGVGAGVVMVLLPATGQFVIPELMGGGQVTLLGSLIQQQFGASRDWPLGSAASSVTLLGVLVAMGVRWFSLFVRRRKGGA